MDYYRPPKFKPPSLESYDRIKDPVNHVQSFGSYLIFYKAFDKMMCRSFPLAFRMAAWNWYSMLKPNYISLFVEFTQ